MPMLALALIAAAPAPDPVAVVRLLAEQDGAVLRVGERLAVASAPLCTRTMPTAGILLQRSDQYGRDYRAAALSELGVTDRPTVTVLVPGGAAEAAGLRARDVVTGVDGHAFPAVAPRRSSGTIAGITVIHDAVDAALADGRAEFAVIRDGSPMILTVRPRPACRARFEVRAGRANSASSDGLIVQVSSDLVAQARGEGQLATILAHELAHNILEHPQRRRAPGPRPSVRETEVQADRLSVYLLDGAGYPIADAVAFWSEWGRANDLGILSDRSHPGWRKRVASIEAEAAAIAAARKAGRPVLPPADLLAPR